MRIYEVQNESGKTVSFVRSFDQAKLIVKQDNQSAKKIHSTDKMTEYSNCFVILAVDIKTDKEGIISKLNSLLDQKSDSPEQFEVEEVVTIPEVQPVQNKTPIGISPAIEFTGNGQGKCLHCKKTVGYVGGFPQVDPPDAIRDNYKRYNG